MPSSPELSASTPIQSIIYEDGWVPPVDTVIKEETLEPWIASPQPDWLESDPFPPGYIPRLPVGGIEPVVNKTKTTPQSP